MNKILISKILVLLFRKTRFRQFRQGFVRVSSGFKSLKIKYLIYCLTELMEYSPRNVLNVEDSQYKYGYLRVYTKKRKNSVSSVSHDSFFFHNFFLLSILMWLTEQLTKLSDSIRNSVRITKLTELTEFSHTLSCKYSYFVKNQKNTGILHDIT